MIMSENTNHKQAIDIRELLLLTGETVCSVEGVSSLADTLTDTLKNLSGMTGQTHGIRISESDGELSMDIYINVYHHTKIPDLAWDIQSAVKEALENKTGYKVTKIDIHVQGVERKEKA